MIDLDDRLQRLAGSVELPHTTPEDDLARGRLRRRRRAWGIAGTVAATAVVITVGSLLAPGGTGSGSTLGGVSTSTSAPVVPEQDAASAVPRPTGQVSEYQRIGRRHAFFDERAVVILGGYRDVLREHLDPAGTRIQTGPITNQQAGSDSIGTKLGWNGGGMLEIAVGRTLEGVQFFCDGRCSHPVVPGASKALALETPTTISVAVFQDDGHVVALTADTVFGNNGTSTSSLGVTTDELLAAAVDPRFDLPAAALLADWSAR